MERAMKRLFKGMKLNFYKGFFTKQKMAGMLSSTEMFSLEVIRLLGKPTVGAFAKFINVPLSNATYKINTLIEKGFIKKSKSGKDKREFYLELTEKCNIINLDEARQQKLMDRVEKRLSAHQLKVLEQILIIVDEEIENDILNKELNI